MVEFGTAIIVVDGLLASATHWPTPSADKLIVLFVQGNIALGVIILVFGLKLAASNKCPIS